MRGYTPLLVLLSAIWGSSYMFIKVAVEEISPQAMITFRLLLAGSVLFLVLAVNQGGLRGAARAVRRLGRGAIVLAVVNSALPFTLIAWGETHVASGVAAIANASVPIFVALFALKVNRGERVTGVRLFGVLLGIVGVGVLAGVKPAGGWWAVAGILAITLASVSYATANLFTQHFFAEESPLVIATATHSVAALLILPFGLASLPAQMPSWKAIGSVAALGILGTSVAALIQYRMITWYGSSRTSLTSYLLTGFALFYGVVILGESVGLNEALGLVMILSGVALGSGLLFARRRRAETVPATPAP